MLKAEHIMLIKLDGKRLLAHQQMPPPRYATKELTTQIAAIGEATISNLLNVEPRLFQMQLEAARQLGVSYLAEDQDRGVIGISAATSLIGNGDIMLKNMILPRDVLWKNNQLKMHYVISVFVRGTVVGGIIPDVSQVEVAGWAETADINRAKREDLPPSFKSKLPVIMVPCSALNPIDSLITKLTANKVCV